MECNIIMLIICIFLKVRKRICTHLYESAEVELQLTNCFTGSGNFRVLLYESDNSNFLHMSGERVSRSSALISSVHLRKRKYSV